MPDLMIVERHDGKEWKEIQFEELKDGDRFRMLDPHTKDLYIGDDNKTEFVVVLEPYCNVDGVLTVQVETERSREVRNGKIISPMDKN